MAILVDFSQIVISTFLANQKFISAAHDHLHGENDPTTAKAVVSEDLLRHMVLNTIRAHRKQFHSEFGELIICIDGRNYWRKEVFKHYKAGRKKWREASDIDWDSFFEKFNKIKEELVEFFPYKVVVVDSAEADDVIAVVCKNADLFFPSSAPDDFFDAGKSTEKILILSSDKDLVQLQRYPNISQWSPNTKKFLKTEDPAMFLKEHIIRGDSGDGVPNFLSDDDTFVDENKSQVKIYTKFLKEWLKQDPEKFCISEKAKIGFARNSQLIDLSNIPEYLEKEIIQAVHSARPKPRRGLLKYFTSRNLDNLMNSIMDF